VSGTAASFLGGNAWRSGTIEPEEEKAWRDCIKVYKFLMGGHEDKGAKLLSVLPSDRIRGDRHSYQNLKFCLKSRKHFLTVRVVKPWERLPERLRSLHPWRGLKST